MNWMEWINKIKLIDNQQLLNLMNVGTVLSLDDNRQLITELDTAVVANRVFLIPCALSVQGGTENIKYHL